MEWCAALLIFAVACSSAEPDHGPPEPPLVPETEYRLPPPPGAIRIEWLDVDVFPTQPVRGGKPINRAVLQTGSGCTMVLGTTRYPDAVLKMVGTLPIWLRCHDAWRCGDFCESRIVPVPFGTAFEVQRIDPPVIHLSTTGGGWGEPMGVRFWKDGLVQFYGPRCRHWRGLRRQLTPAAVEDLLAGFERAGILDSHQPAPSFDGYDARVTGLRITDGDRSLAVTSRPLQAKASALIDQAVGYNPCVVGPAFVHPPSTSNDAPVPVPEPPA